MSESDFKEILMLIDFLFSKNNNKVSRKYKRDTTSFLVTGAQ